MAEVVYIDGRFVPAEEAAIPVFDHGLLYGDGVFEGIRAYDGRIFRLEQHLDRLYWSAERIGLAIPLGRPALTEAVRETLRRNDGRDAYVRLVVTRGRGDLGLDPRRCGKPSVIIITGGIEIFNPASTAQGIEIAPVRMRRCARDGLDPRVKSLNYLASIVAKVEANAMGAQEGLLLNGDGYVAECTAENIFMVRGGELVTPPEDAGILRGVTRDVVLECAVRLGLPSDERLFTVEELCEAEECFLTGTAAELVPVAKVGDFRLPDEVPGPVTRRLCEAFREVTQSEGVPIYD